VSDVVVTKVLTASERPEIHTTIARALSLLAETPGQRVELVRADGASETLSLATAEQPRIAFLDVTIGRGAGVGLVHFLQSVVPGVIVVAIVPEGEGNDVRLVEQAASLGASWVLLGELTGDDVLRAFGRVAPTFAHSVPPPAAPPPNVDDAKTVAEARTFRDLDAGLASVSAAISSSDPRAALITEIRAAIERCVQHERSERALIQDATTSAYSFAYFVDLAGREIDLARRHGRRFGLLTVDATGDYDARALVEVVLSVIRDTDVVARADERELLLLLPETGSKGARILRRRIIDKVQAQVGQNRTPPVRVGIASFPFDGEDLSRLLRIARRRAERWSPWDANVASAKLLRDAIAWLTKPGAKTDTVGPLIPMEVPLREGWSLFDTIVREATRGGDATIAIHATHDSTEPSLGLAQGVRAATIEAMGPNSQGPVIREVHNKDVLSLMTGVSHLAANAQFAGLEVVAVLAEHAAYGLVGRVEDGRLFALHGHDLPIVEALINGLEQPVFRRGTIPGSTPSSSAPGSIRSSRSDPSGLRR
jgi:GGDEF domain-containing protein